MTAAICNTTLRWANSPINSNYLKRISAVWQELYSTLDLGFFEGQTDGDWGELDTNDRHHTSVEY